MESFNLPALAAAIGIIAHLIVSPLIEPSTIKILLSYVTANTLLLSYLIATITNNSISQITLNIISTLITLNTIFLLTATILTLLRRTYISPLRHIPGPRLAALSKLWTANEYRLGRATKTYRQLHEDYDSEFVRVGPNEISISCVEAIEKIYKGKYPRGTFYEVGMLNGALNLNTIRDYGVHSAWRRIWEKAFMTSEFKEYNPRIEYHVEKLIGVLKRSGGKEIDCSKAIDNLVFDIMADLSFANDAGMQDGTGDPMYMDCLHKYVSISGFVGILRNLCQILAYLPETSEVREFRKKGTALLSARQKLGRSRNDIFRHLLAEDSETGSLFTQKQLDSNASLIIAAGADTTASTMTQTMRMLCMDPRILRRLQEEVDEVWEKEGELTVDNAKGLGFLGAVVNEALRLFNPLPSGVHAEVRPEGVEINGTFIPGYTQVLIPHLVIMTNEKYFPRGEEFIPERWLEEEKKLLRDKTAFMPFGYGVHSCVGKQLALNEMRLAIARTVREFDLEFGEGYDDERFDREWKDYMVVNVGALEMKFIPRK